MSNQVIQAKEKTSLLESKIEVLAVRRMATNLKSREKVDADGNTYSVDYVELHATEIRALTDRSGGSLYEDIFGISLSLKNKFHIMFDRENKRYIIRSLYGDITYENGLLQIEYNPDTEYLFKDMKANYTRLSLPILFSFKTNGGFQLYKLLKSFAYNLPEVDRSLSQDQLPTYPVTYALADLRMTMGFVDLNQKDIKREASKRNPDFDKMADMEIKPKYRRWSDFNTRVIKPGLDEINGMSDIYIADIVTDSAGKGSKVTQVTFYIQHNLQYYAGNTIDSQEPDLHIIRAEDGSEIFTPAESASLSDYAAVMEIITDVEITPRDAEVLLHEADGNLSLIRSAYELSRKQEKINNFMGWMRSAIRGEYRESIETIHGSSDRAQAARSFQDNVHQISTHERVWRKTQEKADFDDFLRDIGYSLETLDLIFESPKDKVELYADWKTGRL